MSHQRLGWRALIASLYLIAATLGVLAGGGPVASIAQADATNRVATLTFNVQPTSATPNQIIGGAAGVQVTATDANGHTVSKVPVTLTLIQPNGAIQGTLSGTTTVNTNTLGVAIFGNLSINALAPRYRLHATSGTAVKDSAPFSIATVVNTTCSTGCTVDASAANASDVKVTSSAAGANSSVALALLDPTVFYNPPQNACAGLTPPAPGGHVDVTNSNLGNITTPNKTIVWTLDKAVVQTLPNNGASFYNICLGAFSTADPNQSFTTKSGGQAIFDPATGLFWGILPDCPSQIPANQQPCVLSKTKTGSGDVTLTALVNAPWDEDFFGG